MTLIQASGLVKSYGGRRVVDGLDLAVAAGEVVALIGPNGAGKSTALEMILGLRQPDGGRVTYWREDPLRRVGVQLQTTPFFPGLSARDNLRLFASFYGVTLSETEVTAVLRRCGLAEVAHTEATRLSGGQQKRLAIALTLAHAPEIVFLDEPTAALDPRAQREVRELIARLASEGVAVVFTSHDLGEVARLAHRVLLIHQGQVRAQGTPAELLVRFAAPTLDEVYLALTEEVGA